MKQLELDLPLSPEQEAFFAGLEFRYPADPIPDNLKHRAFADWKSRQSKQYSTRGGSDAVAK